MDDKLKGKQKKRFCKEEANIGEEEITFSVDKEGQHSNFNLYKDSDFNDEHVLYYDWVADNATTSHVTNQYDAFTSYQPVSSTTVAGVGNVKAIAEGRGTVE